MRGSGREGTGGGEGLSSSPGLSYSTSDHASQSRRITAPTLVVETPSGSRYNFSHMTPKPFHIPYPLPVCGHHLPPSIATVYSLLSSTPSDFMPPWLTPPTRESGTGRLRGNVVYEALWHAEDAVCKTVPPGLCKQIRARRTWAFEDALTDAQTNTHTQPCTS